MHYISQTGKTVEVIQTGQSFKSVTIYPATRNSPAETIVKRHRTWGGVERKIKGMRRN